MAGASVDVQRQTGVSMSARAVKRWRIAGERRQIDNHNRRQSRYGTSASEWSRLSRQKFA